MAPTSEKDTAAMTERPRKRTRRLTWWIYGQFISSRGNEYFCEIDEEYLTDRFNLTGLNTEVQYYQYALDLITDVFDVDCDDEMREAIEKSARHLYGLVHARYIVTTRGLGKMVCSRRCDTRSCFHELSCSRLTRKFNSSRSTRRPTLASVRASTAIRIPYCPWVCPTSPT